MDERFEHVDKRFDALEKKVDARFAALEMKVSAIIQRRPIINEKPCTLREVREGFASLKRTTVAFGTINALIPISATVARAFHWI